MTYVGIAKGRMIELQEPLPFPHGQVVNVSVQPADTPIAKLVSGGATPEQMREAMRRAPSVPAEDVDDFDRAIREGRLDIRDQRVFDAGAGD